MAFEITAVRDAAIEANKSLDTFRAAIKLRAAQREKKKSNKND